MKKIIFILFSIFCLFSCIDNDNINQELPFNNTKAITFSKYTDNLTRANTYERLDKTHTSFGVYGFYSDSTEIMNQYLVKFDATKLVNANITYTNPVNGASAWYYDGLDTNDGAAAKQYLKFFDNSKPLSYFIGYSPYKTTDFTTYNKNTSTLTYKNINSFNVHQSITVEDSVKIDKNELLYSKDKHNTYNSDVLINFKRGMAKVQLGFRDNIPGYRIQLIDLDADNNYKGVQLVPAAVTDTISGNIQPAKSTRPTWKDNADVYTVQFKGDTATVLTVTDNSESKNNIVFAATNTEDYTYNNSTVKVIKEGTANYSMSDSVYYMLPQTSTTLGFTLKVSYRLIPEDGTADMYVYDARVYIPNTYCKWEAGKAYKYLVTITITSTGNTNKNVTEEDMGLKDSDGDGLKDTDNDGNPDIPYTSTNPDSSDYYVDGDDPRIPKENALHPIVFEAVVYDYDTSDHSLNLN